METEVKVRVGDTYEARVTAGKHQFVVDEPLSAGGMDKGPNPESLLLSALGCCMAITLRMYANRKGWPLKEVEIGLSFERDKDMRANIEADVKLHGELTPEMHSRMLEIARKCPMHKTLSYGVDITVAAL
jgi:putative redox protein